MRAQLAAACLALAGCAANPPEVRAPVEDCRADVARLNQQLAAETAERQRIARAASQREEALRRQLEAMKSIERGILEREDRMRTEVR